MQQYGFCEGLERISQEKIIYELGNQKINLTTMRRYFLCSKVILDSSTVSLNSTQINDNANM